MPDREPHPDRRRRRRRGPRKNPPESAVAVIAAARPAVDPEKPADVPLTEREAAEMRAHFRFLKEHRKVLALKVNAAEDLLLNGAREPTHRGVCQHLLDKVERSRVELAAQRLDPGSRTRMLEGIIRFSPDVAYLLLYLESLKDAARPDAVPALAAALRRIDFDTVSAAQMRRLLDLIVELTSEADRPQLLFSLLSSGTFQRAFDASAERLPDALAAIVVPLRAAHAVVVRGAPNPFDAEALARGAEMLLSAHESVLRAQVPAVGRRLFDVGIELAVEPAARVAAGLRTLLDGLSKGERGASEPAVRLFRWHVRRGLLREAKTFAAALAKDGLELPRPWLSALDAPRLGPVALTERLPPRDDGRPPRELFVSGLLLPRELEVWVRIGTLADVERYARTAALSAELLVPGVAPVLAHGLRQSGEPFLAVERHGRAANEVILGKAGLGARVAVDLVTEMVAILSALGAAGVRLPDARFRRFAVDEHGRLWLRDLTDAERSENAPRENALLARQACADVLSRAERLVIPSALGERLAGAADCAAIGLALRELG
jgi:hypothetical protein